jgi:hypothetical protein
MRGLDPEVIGEKYAVDIRGLGNTQLSVLFALREQKFWHDRNCGWFWSTNSGTERHMQALIKRGLVAVGTYRKFIPKPATQTKPAWDRVEGAYLLTAGGFAFLSEYELAGGR